MSRCRYQSHNVYTKDSVRYNNHSVILNSKTMSKVLIIEDDQFLRQLMVRKLGEEKVTVLEASDGGEGLEILKKEKPNLVLLDLMLPTMDGFAFMQKMKETKNSTPVVVLSNLGQDSDVTKAKGLGAKDYLVKANFTTEEILQKVKPYL